ncbi:hypothetical protein V492_06007 [Pseudogymnoascus sp. VKM F-4246]|nr:hypothetical protein V492_06007 [Pseudogymnoascus sp. VKM F-4246]
MASQTVDRGFVSDEKPALDNENERLDISEKTSAPATTSSSSISDTEGINEKAILRKLDYKLLPPLTLLYLLSFLDRSNVGNAKLEGLAKDMNFTDTQYLSTLTIYFIGYVIFEIPANIVLKRTTPQFWLPTTMIAWGIVATLLGVCQNFNGFLVARFFLGATESGLFPGVVFYLSMWYKRSETTYRVALFFSAASLAGAFGGILAYGIGHMRGVAGLNGWNWIFILEGILTVVVAVFAYGFIHNYPKTAKFLTEPEREFVQARLKADNDATNHEPFSWPSVLRAVKDPKCWLYGLAFHTLSLPLYTLSLFLPTIIKALGYTAAQAQLMSVPPYAVATVLTVLVAIASEKYKRRAPFIIASSTVAIIGYIILLSAPSNKPGVSYVGTIFAAAGIYPATGIVLAWPANNVSGQTKRATANAMQISIGNLGAVLGTQLYRPSTNPRYYLGHGFAAGYLLANILVALTIWAVLARENRRKQQAERPAVVDESPIENDDDVRWIFQV